ncbi:hypothetical protein M378DRAFT_200011 [Amanita muscaria Koide BX008]|uniref:Uncharacterized protein n=1 Tax=Amanita muscaria (strain Koide BX008) TaxID=946122 RepID=A0A0C2WEK4_AMAMK|nr:hypothetical protein M378DRAFT_200011 [Amanita muscaria Koide BX008]
MSSAAPARCNSDSPSNDESDQPRPTVHHSEFEEPSPDVGDQGNPFPDDMDTRSDPYPPSPTTQQNNSDSDDVWDYRDLGQPPSPVPASDEESNPFDERQADARQTEPDESLSPPMYPPLWFSFDMIDSIKNAKLEDDIEDPEVLETLHSPRTDERIFDALKDGSE